MNTKHITPTLPLLGFNNESATQMIAGMAVKAGAAEGGITLPTLDAHVEGVVGLDQVANQNQSVGVHVGHGGLCYVLSGAAFALHDYLTADATGRWITTATTKHYQAQALSAATAAGQLIPAIRLSGLDVAP
jgi:hypothetical protein